jgi:hypothetical protein
MTNQNDTEYDFTQTINTPQLLDEINSSGIAAPDYINTDGTAVSIFYVSPLDAADLQTLTTVVANHVANPNYITIQQQSDISTLIGYLNNSNPATANTARAIIVSNMAQRLPDTLIQTINAQIAAALGS